MPWNRTTRKDYKRDGRRYESDVTDEAWAIVSRGLQCHPAWAGHGMPGAGAAEGFCALFDGHQLTFTGGKVAVFSTAGWMRFVILHEAMEQTLQCVTWSSAVSGDAASRSNGGFGQEAQALWIRGRPLASPQRFVGPPRQAIRRSRRSLRRGQSAALALPSWGQSFSICPAANWDFLLLRRCFHTKRHVRWEQGWYRQLYVRKPNRRATFSGHCAMKFRAIPALGTRCLDAC